MAGLPGIQKSVHRRPVQASQCNYIGIASNRYKYTYLHIEQTPAFGLCRQQQKNLNHLCRSGSSLLAPRSFTATAQFFFFLTVYDLHLLLGCGCVTASETNAPQPPYQKATRLSVVPCPLEATSSNGYSPTDQKSRVICSKHRCGYAEVMPLRTVTYRTYNRMVGRFGKVVNKDSSGRTHLLTGCGAIDRTPPLIHRLPSNPLYHPPPRPTQSIR